MAQERRAFFLTFSVLRSLPFERLEGVDAALPSVFVVRKMLSFSGVFSTGITPEAALADSELAVAGKLEASCLVVDEDAVVDAAIELENPP